MTIEQVLDAAASGTRLKRIGPYQWYEELLWYQIRDADALKRAGKLNREQYEERRRACIQTARRNEAERVTIGRLMKSRAQLWAAVQQAGTDFAKNPNLETAKKLYEALYHVPLKEEEDALEQQRKES